MNPTSFSFIDLFAGIGGFRMAFESVGGKCVAFSEIAPDAISCYCDNYGETSKSNLGDITKIGVLPPHNLLTAGVPCQSWSIAGKNLGFDDARGQLWNDALFLLKSSMPDAFIFENVKGLADPRNNDALSYIMANIRTAGYYADYHILNARNYGVPQNRTRIYIIGFKNKKFFDRFSLPLPHADSHSNLKEILFGKSTEMDVIQPTQNGQSISINPKGHNDYFLFNDLRNGSTTIHTWDLIPTTSREKEICKLILQNRRKKTYGPLDGNPLSLSHLQQLDQSITQSDIDSLVAKQILKEEKYTFQINPDICDIESTWTKILCNYIDSVINIDMLKNDRKLKIEKVSIVPLMEKLCREGFAKCTEVRYDFKNTKISTGLNGINRIFLPTSQVYPTLVASDTNDYITDVNIDGTTDEEYKANFLRDVYFSGAFRKITKEEACIIQGFPTDFKLPESRPRWMKLIGNSVAVNMIRQLAEKIVATGVFDEI